MAKTKEEYQAAIDEVRAVCKKHGVVLAGVSLSEGVGGEVYILDATSEHPEPNFYEKEDANIVQECHQLSSGFFVESIGDFLE